VAPAAVCLARGRLGAFALANLGAMWLVPTWETVPFHFIWVSLALVYGFRVWNLASLVA
jgi:two-component system, OmpR family, sensor kinase